MNLKRFIKTLLNPHADDIERIVLGFPSALHDDVRKVTKILPFESYRVFLAYETPHEVDFFVSDYRPVVLLLSGEQIQIPYRIYLNEPSVEKISSLTRLQRAIIHCIYLRHHNGHVRQKHLESLVGVEDAFIRPFVIQLVGEYVIELLNVLETSIFTDTAIPNYAGFLVENEFFWKQTQSRMTSYWDAYYRHDSPKLRMYVGKRIVDKLNAEVRRANSITRVSC